MCFYQLVRYVIIIHFILLQGNVIPSQHNFYSRSQHSDVRKYDKVITKNRTHYNVQHIEKARQLAYLFLASTHSGFCSRRASSVLFQSDDLMFTGLPDICIWMNGGVGVGMGVGVGVKRWDVCHRWRNRKSLWDQSSRMIFVYTPTVPAI